MPLKAGKSMLDRLSKKAQESEGSSLLEIPVKSLLHHLQESGITALWLQAADGLEGWQKKKEGVQALMIGDCEYDVSWLIPALSCILARLNIMNSRPSGETVLRRQAPMKSQSASTKSQRHLG